MLNESKKISVYSDKTVIDDQDVRFSYMNRFKKVTNKFPDINLIKQLTLRKNKQPLPTIKSSSKLVLPGDKNCLLNPNYAVVENEEVSDNNMELSEEIMAPEKEIKILQDEINKEATKILNDDKNNEQAQSASLSALEKDDLTDRNAPSLDSNQVE